MKNTLTILFLGLLSLSNAQVANDVCATADDFSGWGFCDFFENYNIGDAVDEAAAGTADCPTCAGGCSGVVNDIWFEFTPDAANAGIITLGTNATLNLEIFDACDGNALYCTTETGTNLFFDLENIITPNITYYARMWYQDGIGPDQLAICFGWNSGVVPVELSDFHLEKTTQAIRLIWETQSEVNNQGFEIQKLDEFSNDWKSIGYVDGSGNSITKKEYSFIDRLPSNGVNYYRLKQMDFDGAYSYSDIVQETWKSKTSFYPNPSNGTLFLSSKQDKPFSIYDLQGKLVLKEESINNKIELNKLESGLYVIKLEDSSQRLFIQK